MQQYLALTIPPLVVLALALWRSRIIQSAVNRHALRLPQWAQPIPPIALSMVAAVVAALVEGRAPDVEATGTVGFVTIGLYHVSKRWISVPIIEQIRRASLGLLLFAAFGCAGMKAPATPRDVLPLVEGAVAVTDAALAVAIDNLPDGTDLTPWAKRVEYLERIAEPLRTGKATLDDVCRELPSVAALGAVVDCDKCTEAATVVQALACGGAQ